MSWLRRLLRSSFPEACPELDLHGFRVPEALAEVEQFLNRAEEHGVGEVRIVCGKGKHSRDGTGVLRTAVAGWLEAHGYQGSYRRDMDRDGRDGAIRVALGKSG